MKRGDNTLVTLPESANPYAASSRGDAFWTRLPQLKIDKAQAVKERIVTVARTHQAHFAFDILRTKIWKILRQNNWTSVAITSPTLGCGKTMVSLNLAFSFASLSDCRTVLVDLDLRQPKVASILGMGQLDPLGKFLKGEATIEQAFVRFGDNLAVSANRQTVSRAAELFHGPDMEKRLAEIKEKLKPDLVLFDLPPMLVNDDVLAFLPYVDGVILVAAAEVSTISEVDICERTLRDESNMLGVVLNKCQFEADKYGYY